MNTANQSNPLKPIKMRKLNKKELQWIENNKEEFVKEMVEMIQRIDSEIKSKESELLKLPTKEDRVKEVMKITQNVLKWV